MTLMPRLPQEDPPLVYRVVGERRRTPSCSCCCSDENHRWEKFDATQVYETLSSAQREMDKIWDWHSNASAPGVEIRNLAIEVAQERVWTPYREWT